MNMKNIFDEIDLDKIKSLLSDLVEIPSYHEEQGVVDYLADRLGKIGVKLEFTQVATNRQNLIASIGSGKKSLILNSHTDTVPVGNNANWQKPPFKLTEEGKNLYGLGSCDAKGSLAAMIIAFETLARYSKILNGRLILQAVCCEESRGRGTLAEAMRGVKADVAIIGEPTDLIPMIGHKGGLGMEITVFGKAAHGSAPEEGLNAISKMANLIKELDKLADEIFMRRDPLFGHASLAVTQIQGGQARNVIPDICTINIDRRLLPGETLIGAVNEIKKVIDDQKSIDKSLNVSIKETIGIASCRISQEEPIVKIVKDSILQITGRNQEVAGFTACCDMWCLKEKAGIPTVILGPGKISIAHKANESIDEDSLYNAAKIYAAIALNWLS